MFRLHHLPRLLAVLALFVLALPMTAAAAPADAIAAADGPGGYWYTVRPGDTWYALSRRTGIPVRELWAANPSHIHYRYWLYVGHRLWIPGRIACPTALEDVAASVESFVNAAGATATSLQRWLNRCGFGTAVPAVVERYALRDVHEADWIVIVHEPGSDPLFTTGRLMVFHGTPDDGYVLVHDVTVEGMIGLLRVGDVNDDGRREIVWNSTTCGVHTCYSELHVDQWTGSVEDALYRDWILGQPQMASAEYSFAETASGDGDSILAHGGLIGSVGAGPQRAWTETYTSFDGRPFELVAREYDPSPCLYHHILDANELYDQAAPGSSGYGPAIDAYEAILADASLEACRFDDPVAELADLRDFARFRLVVAYTAEGRSGDAAAARAAISDPAIAGAADTFLTAYAGTSDVAQACQATQSYAEANPDAWQYLVDWGYANPSFSASQLCAGAASISGRVWSDQCSVADGPYPPPSPGCVMDAGTYRANGVYEAGEPGIADVTVRLVPRPCGVPGMAITDIQTTGANGVFSFRHLEPGDYCVSIDVGDGHNADVLIPGMWTQPLGDGSGYIDMSLSVDPGEDLTEVNFGWDYQLD